MVCHQLTALGYLRRLTLVCLGLMLPLMACAVESTECRKTSGSANVAGQDDRLRMCALIGIWDSIITGNNRHGYSGDVVAWVDDSVTAMRGAIGNLDLLQCAKLEPAALAHETLQLVARISVDGSGKDRLQPLGLTSSVKPCTEEVKPADGLVTFAAGSNPCYFQPSFCSFNKLQLPDEFVVLAAGAYAGRRTGFQIDQSGHEGTQIDVAVHHEKPVVLMLGAYEPTIWNVVWTPDTRIVAVLASGYHRQIIAGLKGDVPTLISSYDNQGACGYFYINSGREASLDSLAHRLFKHPVDMVYQARDGKVLVGESLPPGVPLVTSSSASPEMSYDKNAPLAGQDGLEDAIEKGLLRRATSRDLTEWEEAAGRDSPKRGGSLVNGMRPRQLAPRSDAYVVLKSFTFPAGLYGANSATFLIPKGVRRPKGNPGHSVIYDFNLMD